MAFDRDLKMTNLALQKRKKGSGQYLAVAEAAVDWELHAPKTKSPIRTRPLAAIWNRDQELLLVDREAFV